MLNAPSWTYLYPSVKAFVIVALDERGTQRTVRLESENHAVAYLRQTHGTEAIIAFTHDDGMPVPWKLLNRIHDEVFETIALMNRTSASRDEGQRICLEARRLLVESQKLQEQCEGQTARLEAQTLREAA